jgi:hypothetical protein
LSKWNIKKICHCRRNMFVQLEVLYFAQPLKLKFKASSLPVLITMGPESSSFYLFFDYKDPILNCHCTVTQTCLSKTTLKYCFISEAMKTHSIPTTFVTVEQTPNLN